MKYMLKDLLGHESSQGKNSVTSIHRLIGLVGKASALRTADSGFNSHLQGFFSESSHTSGLKMGTPVAALPGTWRYRVSTGTG